MVLQNKILRRSRVGLPPDAGGGDGMKNIKCRNCFFYRNEWCEKIVDSPDPEEARDCNYFREMTNADRIRAMTDEELAKLLCCTGWRMIEQKECLEWLQQPAEEDEAK